jgi:peptidoglycan/xylan/chitin deacetylase (PgdA/CDA1 family)
MSEVPFRRNLLLRDARFLPFDLMLGLCSSRVFLGAAQRRLANHAALILTYHRIGHPPSGALDPFLYVTPIALDGQLAALKAAGLQPGTLADFARPNHFIVTFDDGFRSVLQLGLPVLAKHGVKAVQFLVAGKLGGQNDWDLAKGDVREPLMAEGEIREWLAAGHEIGSHSLTHPNLRRLNPAAAREELAASKATLEERFSVAVRHFAYPYGGYNDETPKLLREAGYATACTVLHGVNPPGSDPHLLRRITPLTVGELLRKGLHRLTA